MELSQLSAALKQATADGTLDALTIYVHPDTINAFCDAVAEAERDGSDAWDGEPDLEGASSTEAGRYAAKAAGRMLGPKP